MKWVFLTLLFVNLAFFGYQWRQSEDANQPVKPANPNTSSSGGVLLLSERNGRSDREREVEQVLQNPVVLSAEPAESASAEDKAENPNQPDTVPEVREQEEQDSNVADTDEDVIAEVEPIALAPDVCWRIGSFSDLTLAQDISERLTAVDLRTEIKAIDAPTGDYDYRVVIPPMTSMQEAFRRLRELKSRNIDSYVMTQGENAQGISLGLFSTEAAANRHQDQMRSMGYEAVIRTIARVSRGYWINTAPGSIPDAMELDIRAADANIQITETACLN